MLTIIKDAESLRNGDGGIDRCATLLAVSRRALQRRIEADGVTFLGLREDTHKRLAVNYLARGYSCETVALLIGYRQVSQFYRSFRAWFGVPPRQRRRQVRALPGTVVTRHAQLCPSAEAVFAEISGHRSPLH